MDGCFHEDRDELERRIHAMMVEQALPSWVTGYNVEFGNYLDGGDPAVWVNLHVPTDLKADRTVDQQYGMAVVRLRQEFVPLVPGYLALIGITTASPTAA